MYLLRVSWILFPWPLRVRCTSFNISQTGNVCRATRANAQLDTILSQRKWNLQKQLRGYRQLIETQEHRESCGSPDRRITERFCVQPLQSLAATKMGVDSPADRGCEPSLIVTCDHADDPENPRNWPKRKKRTFTVLCGLMAMGSTWSSGIFSTATKAVASEFSVSVNLAHLGTSLFLVGFGTGPLLWAPLSKIHGRRAPMLLPYLACVCFTLGTAISSELYAVFVTRFLAGLFGSAPISITGGVLADMYEPRDRGLAMIGYAGAVVGGPVFGMSNVRTYAASSELTNGLRLTAPIAGSSIVVSEIGWHWTHYVTAICMEFILLLSFVFLEESYAPTILVLKARRLRLSTGKWPTMLNTRDGIQPVARWRPSSSCAPYACSRLPSASSLRSTPASVS